MVLVNNNTEIKRITKEQLRGFSLSDIKKIIVYKDTPLTEEDKKQVDRLYEPSKEEILKGLIPKHINVQIWQFLLESYASEQAARMVAMENATDNAGDMIKELGLQYNKARQSAITTEIIEIVSGANALSS